MARFLFRLGRLVVVSRRHKRVRSTVVFFLRNFLYILAVILTLEVLLISLGMTGFQLPLPERAWRLLAHLVL